MLRDFVNGLLGFAARFALAPWLEPAPFLTFFPAVVAAGLFCGWRRGAVILVLSAVVAHYFFIDPTYSWAFRNTAAAMLVVSYVAVGALLLVLVAALTNAVRQLTAASRCRRRSFRSCSIAL